MIGLAVLSLVVDRSPNIVCPTVGQQFTLAIYVARVEVVLFLASYPGPSSLSLRFPDPTLKGSEGKALVYII